MIKAEIIQEYIDSGRTEIDVSELQDICLAFTGHIVGDVKTDTDGSFYVTVRDAEDNHFDVDLDEIHIP